MAYLALRRVGHVKTDRGWNFGSPEQSETVNDGHIHRVKPICPGAILAQGIVGNLNGPEEGVNGAVEVMYLQPRTGVEEVKSYQHERAAVMRAIDGHILPLKHPQVGEEEVFVPVAVDRSAGVVRQRGEAAVVGQRAGLIVDVLA